MHMQGMLDEADRDDQSAGVCADHAQNNNDPHTHTNDTSHLHFKVEFITIIIYVVD